MSLLFLQLCLQRYAHSVAKMELFGDFIFVILISIMSVLFEYFFDSVIEFFGVDGVTER